MSSSYLRQGSYAIRRKKKGTLIYLFLDFWIVQKKSKRLGKQQFQFHY